MMDGDVKEEDEINLFLLNLLLVMPFYHSNGSLGVLVLVCLLCLYVSFLRHIADLEVKWQCRSPSSRVTPWISQFILQRERDTLDLGCLPTDYVVRKTLIIPSLTLWLSGIRLQMCNTTVCFQGFTFMFIFCKKKKLAWTITQNRIRPSTKHICKKDGIETWYSTSKIKHKQKTVF